MLCSICKCIDPFGLLKPPSYEPEGPGKFSTHLLYPHANSLLVLRDSAREGCSLCSVITRIIDAPCKSILNDLDEWEDIDRLYEPSTEADDEAVARLKSSHAGIFHIIDKSDDENDAVYLEIVFRDTFDLPRSRIIELVVHWEGGNVRKANELSIVTEMPDELSSLMLSETMGTNDGTGSEYAFSLARYWLQDCLQKHELCQRKRQENPKSMPTRVIHVGTTEGRTQPFLHETDGQLAPYVCLSHCWGTKPGIKTTMASILSHKDFIPLEDMPQTFQDAVNITRQLGQQYLWIDSLCIIQDSESDWQRESAGMGDIYERALFTIFAVDASGDTEGCFTTKADLPLIVAETPMFDPVIERCLKVRPGCKSFVQQRVRHIGGREIDSSRATVFDAVKRVGFRSVGLNPLDRRAWTLQESVLTTCSLEYSKHEISWSCPTTHACECVPEGFGLPLIHAQPVESHGMSSMYSLWYSLVGTYTKREITYARDKLPALAGLAAEFSKIVKSKYLAGLWADDLRDGLAWYLPWVNSKDQGGGGVNWPLIHNISSRPKSYRAPSWSWASVTGRVNYDNDATVYHNTAAAIERRRPENHNLVLIAVTGENAELSNLEAQIMNCSVQSSGVSTFGEVTAGTICFRGRLKHALVRPPEKVNPQSGYFIQRGRLSIFDDKSGEEVGGFEPDDSSWIASDVDILPLRAVTAEAKLQCLALEPVDPGFPNKDHAPNIRCFRRVGMVWMFGSRPRFESDGVVTHPVVWFRDVAEVTVAIV